MKAPAIALLLGISWALPSLGWADTAVDAKPLADDEFLKELDAYKVAMTAEQKQAILAVLPSADGAGKEKDKDKEKIAAVRTALSTGDGEVSMRPFLELSPTSHRAAWEKLFEVRDPVARFFSAIYLSSQGDLELARTVHDLLHSEQPSPLQKRLLKSYALGVGIRLESDTPESIRDLLRQLLSEEPKFKPGDPAPDFAAKDVAGKPWRLSALRGKVVRLHFWATDCGPCVGGLGAVRDEVKQYPSDRAVAISICLDDESGRKKYDELTAKYDIPWIQMIDGGNWGGPLARTYGINSIPFDVIIDQQGIIKSNDAKDVQRLLEAADAAK